MNVQLPPCAMLLQAVDSRLMSIHTMNSPPPSPREGSQLKIQESSQCNFDSGKNYGYQQTNGSAMPIPNNKSLSNNEPRTVLRPYPSPLSSQSNTPLAVEYKAAQPASGFFSSRQSVIVNSHSASSCSVPSLPPISMHSGGSYTDSARSPATSASHKDSDVSSCGSVSSPVADPYLPSYDSYYGSSAQQHISSSGNMFSRSHHSQSTRLTPTRDERSRAPSQTLHNPPKSSSSSSSANVDLRYVCSLCNRRFSRPSSVRTHMYSHTGERPYVCARDNCGKTFNVRSNLKRHERTCFAGQDRRNDTD